MKKVIILIILIGLLAVFMYSTREPKLTGDIVLEKVIPVATKIANLKADLETHKMAPTTAQEIANYFNGTGKKNTAGQVYITPAERDEFILLVNNVKHKYKINEIKGSGDPVEMLKKMLKDTAVLERAEKL